MLEFALPMPYDVYDNYDVRMCMHILLIGLQEFEYVDMDY